MDKPMQIDATVHTLENGQHVLVPSTVDMTDANARKWWSRDLDAGIAPGSPVDDIQHVAEDMERISRQTYDTLCAAMMPTEQQMLGLRERIMDRIHFEECAVRGFWPMLWAQLRGEA